MLKYIFITTFILIYALSFFRVFDIKSSRTPALIMFIGYVLYIFFIHPLVYKIVNPVSPTDGAMLYFLLLGVLDTFTGLFIYYLYNKKKITIVKYIAILQFLSVSNHLYGRIVYYPGWKVGVNYDIYQSISILIVLSIIALMTWPIINGSLIIFNKANNRFWGRGGDMGVNVRTYNQYPTQKTAKERRT